MTALAQKIRNLRKQKAMTQEELAEVLCISRQTVSKWESGDYIPDTENLAAICKLFGVSMDYMTGIDTAKITHNKKRSNIYSLISLAVFAAAFVLFAIFTLTGRIDAASSVIVLDGKALICIACFILMIISAVIFIKRKHDNKDDKKT